MRAVFLLTFVALALAACSGLSTSTASSGGNLSGAAAAYAAVQQLNYYRAIASLPPAQLDYGITAGAQAHADYLLMNSVSLAQVGLSAHTEQVGMPGYSTAGAAAGMQSVIYEGVQPVQAIDNWMRTFYHRLGLMDPNLHSVGFGSAGPYQVMDIGHGRLRGWEAQPAIGLFPCPGMQYVDGSYVREIPHPISGDEELGIPITAEFFGLRGLSISNVSAHVFDLAFDREIGAYVQHPGRPFLPGWDLEQLIAIIPHNPLPPASTILVSVSATVDGAPFEAEWQFTTR